MSNVGTFEELVASGQFAVTAGLSPPDSADPEDVYSRARVFDGYVDAIYAGNGSAPDCHMSNVAVCALLERRGYTTILPISELGLVEMTRKRGRPPGPLSPGRRAEPGRCRPPRGLPRCGTVIGFGLRVAGLHRAHHA